MALGRGVRARSGSVSLVQKHFAGVHRSKLPEVATPPEGKLPRLQRETLSNGLKVVLAERHDPPVVNVEMLFDAG
jgi:zinc protease